MTDDEQAAVREGVSTQVDQFMRQMGEKYPWLHPDFDPESYLWRERARRAWNARGRKPYLY